MAGARENLRLAAAIIHGDPLLKSLEKQIALRQAALDEQKTLKDRHIAFNKWEEQGRLRLKIGDIDQAKIFFQEAEALDAKNPIVKEILNAIQQRSGMQESLSMARNALREKNLKACGQHLLQAFKTCGNLFKFAKQEISFKEPADSLAADYRTICQAWMQEVEAVGNKHQEHAETAWKMKEYILVSNLAVQSRMKLQELRALLPNGDDILIKELVDECFQLDQKIRNNEKNLDLVEKKAAGQVLLARGVELSKEGRKTFALAKADSSHLLLAIDELEQACKVLEQAALCPETAVDAMLKDAVHQRDLARKMKSPFDIDFSLGKGLPLIINGNEWKINPTLGCIETARVDRAVLQSPSFQCPSDFEFRLEFGLLDNKGRLNNSNWRQFENLLTIKFVDQEEKNKLIISLGQDPGIIFQDLPHVKVRGKSYSIGNFIKDDQPMVLRINNNTLNLNGRIIAIPDFSNDFTRIIILTKSGQDSGQHFAFPALMNMSLKWVKTK